jgi:zinc transporter ZupT
MDTLTNNPVIAALLCGAILVVTLLALLSAIKDHREGNKKPGLIAALAGVLLLFAALLVPIIVRLLRG